MSDVMVGMVLVYRNHNNGSPSRPRHECSGGKDARLPAVFTTILSATLTAVTVGVGATEL